MDFTLTERERSFQARVRAFMADKVRPRVAAVHAEIAEADRWAAPLPSIEALKAEARAAGLWNLFMPPPPKAWPSRTISSSRANG